MGIEGLTCVFVPLGFMPHKGDSLALVYGLVIMIGFHEIDMMDWKAYGLDWTRADVREFIPVGYKQYFHKVGDFVVFRNKHANYYHDLAYKHRDG